MASALIPAELSWKNLRDAAKPCQACPLWKNATQTVFGEGAVPAAMMLVGEEPGNEEDKQGHPFVGPAGRVLDEALEAAGIDRKRTYVTNIVKHFKWEPRGKRRIHVKPSAVEIAACVPWLQAELEIVRPEVLVCLGATAAKSLLGREFRVTQSRGTFVKSNLAPHVTATIHPSAILRAPDPETRHAEMARFIADLKVAASVVG